MKIKKMLKRLISPYNLAFLACIFLIVVAITVGIILYLKTDIFKSD